MNKSLQELQTAFQPILKKLKDHTELQKDFRDKLLEVNRPLRLAVVGEFSSGKSTFINALLQKDLLPEGILPTTGVATYIQQGEP